MSLVLICLEVAKFTATLNLLGCAAGGGGEGGKAGDDKEEEGDADLFERSLTCPSSCLTRLVSLSFSRPFAWAAFTVSFDTRRRDSKRSIRLLRRLLAEEMDLVLRVVACAERRSQRFVSRSVWFFEDVFSFGSKGFGAICYYTFSNEVAFF